MKTVHMGDDHNPRDRPRNERRKDPRHGYANVCSPRRLVRRPVRRLPSVSRPQRLAQRKGLYILDYWTTTMQATVKELTADTIAAAMTAAKKTTEENVAGYDVIVPKSAIELDDYTENVTYIGRLVGSEKPIIIQIFNAFNTNDLSIQPKDNDEASVQVIFTGHYDPNDLETPPYKIYWPKEA